ncbi:MAG: Flp pilus assembly complex ATPase component TadA [Comamonadaceae bacterium]|nr:Flp pilus assembly complex ATPase component TadA [Comamonadaceae bacterium]
MDDKIVVRYRVDGILDTVREFPLNIHKQMVSRIKVMSGMDITETRIPQDGRIQTARSPSRAIDLRVSTLPDRPRREGRDAHPRQVRPSARPRRSSAFERTRRELVQRADRAARTASSSSRGPTGSRQDDHALLAASAS